MSVLALSRTVLVHGGRSIRRGGLPFFFSLLMTALGAFSLGAFLTMVVNFERIAKSVGESVAAVAFLRVDGAADAEEVRARIALLDGVADARLVSPEEALQRATRGLGDAGKALEGAAGVTMPWVVEVAPRFDVQRASDRTALEAGIRGIAGVDEVLHPSGELARIDALMRLLLGAGAFLGVLIAFVVVIVVSNAVKLTVHARSTEIQIMKLVGATDGFVRLPLLLSGLVQGAGGALLGLVVLTLAHASLAQVARVALSGALGTFVLEPMPVAVFVLLLVGGAALGVVGALLSVRRFLKV